MTITEIAKQYVVGRNLRNEAKQLSNPSLAKKFERSEKTIAKIANGMPCDVPADEQKLIRGCIAERDRLKSKAAELSMPRLCKLHKVSHHTVFNRLVVMGEVEL